MPKHRHADLIREWTEDTSRPVQWRDPLAFTEPDYQEWKAVRGAPHWLENLEYRFAPAKPEYPVSSMSDVQLGDAFEPRPDVMWNSKACRNLADTALRVEFEKGSIITKAEHEGALYLLGEALRQCATKMNQSAVKTLESLGYTDCGGELWKPPLGKQAGHDEGCGCGCRC